MNRTILTTALSIAFAISANANTVLSSALTAPDSFNLTGLTQVAFTKGPMTVPASPNSTFTAIFDAGVYADPNNVFGAGDYDFVYQVSDTGTGTAPGSQGIIANITAAFFSGFSTDAGTDTNATAPTGFTAGGGVPLNDNLSSGVVEFNFTPNITVGTHSAILVVETNATNYTTEIGRAHV